MFKYVDNYRLFDDKMVKFQVSSAERRIIRNAERSERRQHVSEVGDYRTNLKAGRRALRDDDLDTAEYKSHNAKAVADKAAFSSVFGKRLNADGEFEPASPGPISAFRVRRAKRLEDRVAQKRTWIAPEGSFWWLHHYYPNQL